MQQSYWAEKWDYYLFVIKKKQTGKVSGIKEI